MGSSCQSSSRLPVSTCRVARRKRVGEAPVCRLRWTRIRVTRAKDVRLLILALARVAWAVRVAWVELEWAVGGPAAGERAVAPPAAAKVKGAAGLWVAAEPRPLVEARDKLRVVLRAKSRRLAEEEAESLAASVAKAEPSLKVEQALVARAEASLKVVVAKAARVALEDFQAQAGKPRAAAQVRAVVRRSVRCCLRPISNRAPVTFRAFRRARRCCPSNREICSWLGCVSPRSLALRLLRTAAFGPPTPMHRA